MASTGKAHRAISAATKSQITKKSSKGGAEKLKAQLNVSWVITPEPPIRKAQLKEYCKQIQEMADLR